MAQKRLSYNTFKGFGISIILVTAHIIKFHDLKRSVVVKELHYKPEGCQFETQ
jgi:hypothetical protein